MIAEQLSQELGCTLGRAEDALSIGQDLAKSFARLRSLWDIDLLIEAHQFIRTLEFENYPDGFGNPPKLKTKDLAQFTRGRLRKPIAALIDAFESCKLLKERLEIAEGDLKDCGMQIDASLATFLFGFLHQRGALSQPEQVVEGRALYDGMCNDKGLMDGIGIVIKGV